ncbi:hypothetical protein Z947_2688 [Sulfitobacter geojensis]|nr:hypothetical protein Z947_2688 [Sulfitobacter geojensis]
MMQTIGKKIEALVLEQSAPSPRLFGMHLVMCSSSWGSGMIVNGFFDR